METVLIAIILLAAGLALGVVLGIRRRPRPGAAPTIHSTVQSVRSIGQLSAYKIFTKEIVTQTDHSWGEIGKRYLSWVLSRKKMAMIFEFAIDLKYDLRSADFAIHESAPGDFVITMPPPTCDVQIRNIYFYDEQGAKLLPWLLPDLLNSFLPTGFSEEDKNRLVSAARAHAEQQALKLIENYEPDVQGSAETTLRAICRSLGASNARFEFLRKVERDLSVVYPEKISA